MPLSIPTLADLRTQNRANFAARLTGADTTLRRAVTAVLADLCAYPLYAAYRGLVWVSRQLFADSAESPYLDRMGAEYGIVRAQATASVLAVDVTFTQAATLGAGTVLQTSDLTQGFAVVTTASGSPGTSAVNVTAQTPGSAGNLAPGALLTLTTAIAGITPTAQVASVVTEGTDQESNASLAARIIARKQNPPQGGAGADFWAWARGSGVPTRAWVSPLVRGAGSINIPFVIDTRPDNIPLTADVNAVAAAVQAAAPVIGSYLVYAPTADALSITISNLVPNTAATQAAIVAQLNALIASVPPGGTYFGDGVTVALTTGALFPIQVPGTLYLSMIHAAIEAAGGIGSYDLTAPSADVIFANGHLPAPPTIVFA